MLKQKVVCVGIVVLGLVPVAARGETDLSKFGLLKAVPADAFITAAGRGNAEREFVDRYWEDVIKAVDESEVLLDVWDMLSENIPDEQLDEFEDTKDRLIELCDKVAWGEWMSREMVHAGRFMPVGQAHVLLYEGLLAGRLPKDEVEKNYEAMRAVFAETVRFINAMAGEGEAAKIVETEAHGATISSVLFVQFEGFGLRLARRGDVILVTFGGTKLMDESLSLLEKGGEGGMADTARFKQAIAKLPPAEDAIVFFDTERMMSSIRRVFPDRDPATTQPGGSSAGDEFISLMNRALKDVSIVDYVASVNWTDGYRTFEDNYTRQRDNAKESLFYQALAYDRPIENFAKYVPKEADSFAVDSGIRLPVLYDWAVDVVKDSLTDGGQYVEQFNDFQHNVLNLDIKRDVLDLIDGQSVSVTMGEDWVQIIKVTDVEKLHMQIERLVKVINRHAGQFLGPDAIQLQPMRIGKHDQFYQVSVPMMAAMMMGPGGGLPIIGYSEGQFFMGSSKAALRKCLNTAAGEHPNITESERWKEEALAPKGEVVYIHFTDEMEFGEELKAMFSELTMGVNMMQLMPVQLPPPVQKFIGKVSPFLPKLAKIAEKFDFYRSSAGYTVKTADGWMDRTVQTYKTPAEVKKLRDRKKAVEENGVEGPDGAAEDGPDGE